MPFLQRLPPPPDEAPISDHLGSRIGHLKSQLGSVRFRLTVWNSIVVLGAALAALLALREAMRYTLEQEIDDLLREETIELVLAVQELHPDQNAIFDEFARKASGHAPHGWFVQLLGAEGQMLWESPNTPRSIRRRPFSTVQKVALFTHDGYRVGQRCVDGGTAPPYTVRIGTPTENIRGDVNRLVRLMIPIGLALAALAPLGGYLLARRATAPVRQIIATTRRLRPSRLNERLIIRGTGDELDQLSTEINHFLDQIAGYLERHREFIGNAAHELRSPLTAIQASVDVTLNKERSPDEYQELLYTLSDECDRLRVLVNQLLTVAENDTVGLERPTAPVRLDEIVEKSLDVFTALAEDRQIALQSEVQPSVIVPGDAMRLRQVVNNLLDNALKFTNAGGRVSVSLHCDTAQERAVLTVRDTGIGIPREELPRVFDRFFVVDKSHSRDGVHGNGLGLCIVESVVHLHGGVVEVESDLGRGALFRVKVPIFRIAIAQEALRAAAQ